MSTQTFVPIYNPLGSHLAAYARFRAWRSAWQRRAPLRWLGVGAASRRPGADVPALLRRYRPHIVARNRTVEETARITLADELQEDRSAAAEWARSFVMHVCERADLPPGSQAIRLVFPAVDLFDARCIEVEGTPAVFVTTRAVEMISCFARTVSLCARLNALAAPAMLAMADSLPPSVLLAWETMRGAEAAGVLLSELLELPAGDGLDATVTELVFGRLDWLDPESRRAQARCMLSFHLMQGMLQTVSNAVRGRRGVEPMLRAAHDPGIAPSDRTIDAEYFALLTLAFIALHETGHLVLGHNRLEAIATPMDQVLRNIADASAEVAREYGTEFVDFMDTTLSYEAGADRFALQAADDVIQHPLLEAATLWLTALESTNEAREDWVKKTLASRSGAHPPFAMRVWQLNGEFSRDARQGWAAQEITRRAESMADRVHADFLPAEAIARIFPVLWNIALREVRAG